MTGIDRHVEIFRIRTQDLLDTRHVSTLYRFATVPTITSPTEVNVGLQAVVF